MNKKKYPELSTLLSCYFHQDMDLDYKSPEEALRSYVFRTHEDYLKLALLEIEKLKNEYKDPEELWNMIEMLGCEYRYNNYYYTPKKWLDYVFDTIKKCLKEKQQLELGGSRDENTQRM